VHLAQVVNAKKTGRFIVHHELPKDRKEGAQVFLIYVTAKLGKSAHVIPRDAQGCDRIALKQPGTLKLASPLAKEF
jgi:hypothetical protein